MKSEPVKTHFWSNGVELAPAEWGHVTKAVIDEAVVAYRMK